MEARRRKEEEERRKQDEIDRKNAVSIRHLICIILRFFPHDAYAPCKHSVLYDVACGVRLSVHLSGSCVLYQHG